jgi:hypothetical protein
VAAATIAGTVLASPAAAAPAVTPTHAGAVVPLKLSPPTIKPGVAQPVGSDNCAAVRANLKRYVARHVNAVSCSTITRSGTPAAPHTGAPSATPSSVASLCTTQNDIWVYDRTEECIQDYQIVFYATNPSTGATVGLAVFTLTQDLALSTTSGEIDENDTVNWTVGTGVLSGLGTVSFGAGCGAPCTVVAGAQTFELTVGATKNLSFEYNDAPAPGAQDKFTTGYAMDFEVPNVLSLDTPTWNTVLSIRCDNQLTNRNPGCVFPDAAPVLVLSAAVYGAAAVNVAIGEGFLAGSPGTASSPLTRGDPANSKSNRAAICDSTFIPSNTLAPDDSCDEYPFASSQQSGGQLGLTGVNCLEAVPLDLNGSWYVEFVNTNTGTQQCERGHVTSSLNRSVGSQALGPMYTLNRMLPGDPYTIQVTP